MTISGRCVGIEFAITFLGNPSASSEFAIKSNWTNKNPLEVDKNHENFCLKMRQEIGGDFHIFRKTTKILLTIKFQNQFKFSTTNI